MAARINQSPYVLLGLLNLGPRSGYDLKQLIGWSIGHFWREGYGQIYPSLKQLENKGWIVRQPQQQNGSAEGRRSGATRQAKKRSTARPERKVYAITVLGRKQLRAWLERPAAEDVPRNETLLKVFFGALASPTVNLDHVLAERERHARALKAYREIEHKLKTESGSSEHLRYWLATLNYGRRVSEAVVGWAEEVLAHDLKQPKGTEGRDA